MTSLIVTDKKGNVKLNTVQTCETDCILHTHYSDGLIMNSMKSIFSYKKVFSKNMLQYGL